MLMCQCNHYMVEDSKLITSTDILSTYCPVYSEQSAWQAPYGPKDPTTSGFILPTANHSEMRQAQQHDSGWVINNCNLKMQFHYNRIFNEKNAQRRKHCSKAEPKIFVPPQTPSQCAGQPKFNQVEMVTTVTYRPRLVRTDAHNFELLW